MGALGRKATLGRRALGWRWGIVYHPHPFWQAEAGLREAISAARLMPARDMING
jgi:hypothetical protein